MKRFPCTIFFRELSGVVQAVAVAPQRRRTIRPATGSTAFCHNPRLATDGAVMSEIAENRIDPVTRDAVVAFMERLAPRFPVREAILFGSRARGTARRDSDADVAVILRGKRGAFLRVKLEMADAAFDNLLETGILVQPLPVWEDEREQPEAWSNPELPEDIARTGVRVW